MYKPANIREFVTPAVHKKFEEVEINGRLTKQLKIVGNARGKFKQKGSLETNANGLTAVVTKTTYTTWYKATYAAADVLTINGVDYQVKGDPENVENRGRYTIMELEKLSGGA